MSSGAALGKRKRIQESEPQPSSPPTAEELANRERAKRSTAAAAAAANAAQEERDQLKLEKLESSRRISDRTRNAVARAVGAPTVEDLAAARHEKDRLAQLAEFRPVIDAREKSAAAKRIAEGESAEALAAFNEVAIAEGEEPFYNKKRKGSAYHTARFERDYEQGKPSLRVVAHEAKVFGREQLGSAVRSVTEQREFDDTVLALVEKHSPELLAAAATKARNIHKAAEAGRKLAYAAYPVASDYEQAPEDRAAKRVTLAAGGLVDRLEVAAAACVTKPTRRLSRDEAKAIESLEINHGAAAHAATPRGRVTAASVAAGLSQLDRATQARRRAERAVTQAQVESSSRAAELASQRTPASPQFGSSSDSDSPPPPKKKRTAAAAKAVARTAAEAADKVAERK